MSIVFASGSPYEIGQTRGESAPELVKLAVAHICGLDGAERYDREKLRIIQERLLTAMPRVVAESIGVAAGAGISEREALALSVAPDLLSRLPGYCSLVSVRSDEGTVLAKNLDSDLAMRPLQVIERIRPDEGLEYVHLTTAGAMWTDGGVNTAGLAMVNASLLPADTNPAGYPDGIVTREMLRECSTVAEAIDFARGTPTMTFGENLLIADATGRITNLQLMPHGVAVNDDEPIACCNHPADAFLLTQMAQDDPIAANSRRRLDRLRTELSRASSEPPVARSSSLLGSVVQTGDSGLFTIAQLLLQVEQCSLGFARAGSSTDEAPSGLEWTDLGEWPPTRVGTMQP
jgi:hypothetical protein